MKPAHEHQWKGVALAATAPNLFTDFNTLPSRVETVLREFFQPQKLLAQEIGDPVTWGVELLEDYVLGGGKRIRPTFAWAGYLAAGGGEEDPTAVLKAISSLELIQACALIHDDIIDSSDSRRGNPTVHKIAEAKHNQQQWHKNATQFGHSIGILVGDLAMVWADDLFHGSGLSPASLARALPAWRAMRTEVIGGQILDINLEVSGSDDISAAQQVNRYKTAAYTIERPLHIGAALAGADEDLITALRRYGTDIGIAFQLRDDLLGVFGDPQVTGKPAGDDLREGKRTVLVATALQLAHAHYPSLVPLIASQLGAVRTPTEIANLAAAIAATGAVENIEKQITELRDSGLQHLNDAHLPQDIQQVLERLAISATARKT